MNKLSSELIYYIIDLLPKQHVYNCISVCKYMYLPATKKFYSEFTFEHNHHELLNYITKTRLRGEKICQFIKQLNFVHFTTTDPLSFEEFSYLISSLSYLEEINFNTNEINLQYMEYLEKIDNLYHIRSLQVIKYPYDLEVLYPPLQRKYIELARRLQSSLRQLEIPDEFVYDRLDCISYIHEFRHITHLLIRDYHIYSGADIPLLLNACPNLTHFVMMSDSTANTHLTPKFLQHQRLKVFELDIAHISSRELDHILDQLPDHMWSFKLVIRGSTYHEWVAYEGAVDVLNRIMQKAKHINMIGLAFSQWFSYTYDWNDETLNKIKAQGYQEKTYSVWDMIRSLQLTHFDVHLYVFLNRNLNPEIQHPERVGLFVNHHKRLVEVLFDFSTRIEDWTQYLDFSLVQVVIVVVSGTYKSEEFNAFSDKVGELKEAIKFKKRISSRRDIYDNYERHTRVVLELKPLKHYKNHYFLPNPYLLNC